MEKENVYGTLKRMVLTVLLLGCSSYLFARETGDFILDAATPGRFANTHLEDTLTFEWLYQSPNLEGTHHNLLIQSWNCPQLICDSDLYFAPSDEWREMSFIVPPGGLWYSDEYPVGGVPEELWNTSGYDRDVTFRTNDTWGENDHLMIRNLSTRDTGLYDSMQNNTTDQPVPEPGTWAMMGTGLMGFLGMKYREWRSRKHG